MRFRTGKIFLPLEFRSFTGGLCAVGLLQQTFQRFKSFSFQGLMPSIYSEFVERNYTIRFDPTQGLELPTNPIDWGSTKGSVFR